MSDLLGVSDEALVAEVQRRAKASAGAGGVVGAAGAIPGVPPFLEALLRPLLIGVGGGPAVAAINRLILNTKVPKGGGKTLPVGHEVKVAEFNARGGTWEAIDRLKGPAPE
jgi:hypothetical protein